MPFTASRPFFYSHLYNISLILFSFSLLSFLPSIGNISLWNSVKISKSKKMFIFAT